MSSDPNGYTAWLTEVGGTDAAKLGCKERAFGREVPKSKIGRDFDSSIQKELEKWEVKRCYEKAPRSAAAGENVVTCRSVHRWKPEDSAAAGSQVIVDRRKMFFDVSVFP